jgi:hypothetical protein
MMKKNTSELQRHLLEVLITPGRLKQVWQLSASVLHEVHKS